MQSLTLCYTAADADFAHELAIFIELNCAATVFDKEGAIEPGADLIDAAERALSSDYVLLLLSPDSVPAAWLRERWEPVLVDEARKFGTQVAYILLRACKFPEVLRRNAFFDLSEHRLAGQRALKRWLLQRNPFFETAIELPERSAPAGLARESLDHLECRLADQPGVQADVPRELALAFAQTHVKDFEGVFWVNCANRSRAGIVGDTGQILRLKLCGAMEHNARALREFCGGHRLLFVFEHIAPSDRELLAFGGKASVMFIVEYATPAQRPLEDTAALFSAWRANFDECLQALGDAQIHVRNLPVYSDERWRIAMSLGSAASSCLRHAGRLAEAYELLQLVIDALHARGDLLAAAQWEWEKSWILEEWGETVPLRMLPIASSHAAQLSLEFGE